MHKTVFYNILHKFYTYLQKEKKKLKLKLQATRWTAIIK